MPGVLPEILRLGRIKDAVVNDIDWAAVSDSAGVVLPSDFRWLMDRLPPVVVQGSLLLSPPSWSESDGWNYWRPFAEGLTSLRLQRELRPSRIPFVLPGLGEGFLVPWARTVGGNQLFWEQNSPNPDEWTVLVSDSSLERWQRFPGSASDFVADLVNDVLVESFVRSESNEAWRLIEPSTERDLERDRYWSQAEVHPRDLQRFDEVDDIVERIGARSTGLMPDWTAIERQLGTALPSDYKRLMDTVGPGFFADIEVVSPDFDARSNGIAGMLWRAALLAGESGWRNADGRFDGPLYPEVGGLIPWGIAGGDWCCFWVPLPRNDPDVWPSIVFEPGWGGYFYHHKTMTTFLREYLAEPLGCPPNLIKPPIDPRTPLFVPASV